MVGRRWEEGSVQSSGGGHSLIVWWVNIACASDNAGFIQ